MPLPTSLSLDQLGYMLHTSRELGMMLRGEKPLAVFADIYGGFPDSVLRYLRLFDRQVDLGRLSRREFVEHSERPTNRLHMILYALPDEEWRIDAMIELRRRLTDWNAECERREGFLLGYADWQNDIWIARRFPAG